MADTTTTPRATDMLSVRSRVSWGAIVAGAMVALAIYIVLTVLGVALSIQTATTETGRPYIGTGAAIYAIFSLLLSMFFGGWATSRLAVGESKLEAVLYGVILWGLLFAGIIWLVSAGVRTGFAAMVGLTTGAYEQSSAAGQSQTMTPEQLADIARKAGLPEEQARKVQDRFSQLQANPAEAIGQAAQRQDVQEVSGTVAWLTLLGIVVSMATVIFGSLVGSGELLQPVPVLGVRRTPSEPRT